MELKPKIDLDYEDREVKFVNTRKEMLSDLTERERKIYFAGVKEGFRDGGKLILLLFAICLVVIFVTYVIFEVTK